MDSRIKDMKLSPLMLGLVLAMLLMSHTGLSARQVPEQDSTTVDEKQEKPWIGTALVW